ncbi:PP2C family protein-serine/threonine phosphatase [Flammeovirga sp. OC4]|uniref:PP2C family protein-serine/threonine phosphatase n=1 Tax=Flammeovirga sp. OC4 TaxID=1382345 RepID=UPI0009E65C26|nr:SpoIIE family protein phosphatase [Flammeovirga sp. OC4]
MNNQNNFLATKLKLILYMLIGFIFVDIPLGLHREAVMLGVHTLIYAPLLFIPYNKKLKNYILHVYITIIVLSFCIVQGGIFSPVIYFFLSPIMSAYLSFGAKVGRYFATASFVCIVTLFVIGILGLNPFPPLDVSSINIHIFTFAIIIGVGMDVLITITNYNKLRDEAENILRDHQNEILQQEEELKQQQEEIIAIQEQEIKNEKLEKQQHELDKIKAENSLEAIKTSIEYASKIQLNTLPSDKILKDYFAEYYIYYQPKDTVGGDYYYVNNFMGTTIVAMIDCYNQGLTGMLLGTVITSYLDTLQRLPSSPTELIYELHQYIRDNFNYYSNLNERGCNMSIVYIEDHHIIYSGASGIGYIVNENGTIPLKSSDRSIGKTVSAKASIPYKDYEYDISSDDVIILSTDGFVNHKTKKGEVVGHNTLEGLIKGFYNGYHESWKESFDKYITENFAKEQEDDITVLCFNLT